MITDNESNETKYLVVKMDNMYTKIGKLRKTTIQQTKLFDGLFLFLTQHRYLYTLWDKIKHK